MEIKLNENYNPEFSDIIKKSKGKYKKKERDPEAVKRQLGGLIPAKPGEVRNPNGRPKKSKTIAPYIEKGLDIICEDGETYGQKVAMVLLEEATNPNSKNYAYASKEVLERVDGKVPNELKAEHDVQISISYVFD